MFQLKNFIPRPYQESIVETCKEYNTLVILPTGIGKTAISLMLALIRLNTFPNSKVILCSPTKPLCNQHLNTFKKHTTLNPEEINLLTGEITTKKRKELWEKSKIIIATPQTIESDLKHQRISLKNISMLCIDEAHRSRMNYANTIITKKYQEQGENQRILGLTASPGGTKDKIEEIKENLGIEKIELRTEQDKDILPYIQKKEIEWIHVELPEEFKKIHKLIKNVYDEKIKDLTKIGVRKPLKFISKKDLLILQIKLREKAKRGQPTAFFGISLIAKLMKLNYLLELLETQGLKPAYTYLTGLQNDPTKAAKSITKEIDIIKANNLIEDAIEKNIQHPKMIKLYEIIDNQLKENEESKIIVFANYRNTINEIVKGLKEKGIKAHRFVGQANRKKKGLKQKEQIEIIEKFKQGEFNILVSSQVGEEGIDIIETTAVIFFEPTASELRKIQRAGRTARTKPGRIIHLITKETRDQAYYWASHRKEKKMKSTLLKMQNQQEKQSNLKTF